MGQSDCTTVVAVQWPTRFGSVTCLVYEQCHHTYHSEQCGVAASPLGGGVAGWVAGGHTPVPSYCASFRDLHDLVVSRVLRW